MHDLYDTLLNIMEIISMPLAYYSFEYDSHCYALLQMENN